MTESAHDIQIKDLIILSCGNHILNLILRNSIEDNKGFATRIESITCFQEITHKWSHAANGKNARICLKAFGCTYVCLYVCRILNWILIKSNELAPSIRKSSKQNKLPKQVTCYVISDMFWNGILFRTEG
jgi:hypothetical protein